MMRPNYDISLRPAVCGGDREHKRVIKEILSGNIPISDLLQYPPRQVIELSERAILVWAQRARDSGICDSDSDRICAGLYVMCMGSEKGYRAILWEAMEDTKWTID